MEQTKQSSGILSSLIVGLKLLLICAIIAGVVSFVYGLTKEVADANIDKQKADAIGAIFGVTDGSLKLTELKKETDGTVINKIQKNDNTLIGYSVEIVEPSGYNGNITLVVGYDANLQVCGVKINDHGETPGLGAKITEDSFLDQFKGIELEISYDDVDGISSATYSSKAVTVGVNRATAALRALILGEEE